MYEGTTWAKDLNSMVLLIVSKVLTRQEQNNLDGW